MNGIGLINERLISKNPKPPQSTEKHSLWGIFISFCSRVFMREKKSDGGCRPDAEERVYSWIYALARSEKDLAFEFVRSTERGLGFKEAERRLKENGQNIPVEFNFPSLQQLLWRACFHPFNLILVVMSILSYLAADSANGCIMLVLVVISVSIRYHQEYSSSRTARQLSELLRSPVRVQRCAGRINQTELVVQIDQRDIVPGDIIHICAGDLFPGDVRLLTSKELNVSQSSLTGESGTTEKVADITENPETPLLDLKNICFMGTSVMSGSGTALVISTGSNTYMSTIYSTLGKEKQLDAFDKGVWCVSYMLIGLMVVAIPAVIIATYCASHDLSESIIFGISVAVALTPQMLPLVVNTSLARGAIVMAEGRCIVKRISSIQNMGEMDILCIDKTGTLTVDKFIMIHHWDTWGLRSDTVLRFAFLNSYFKTDLKGPIDDAVLAYAYTNGYRFQASQWRKIDELPFDFTRRIVSVIIEKDISSNHKPGFDNTRYVITKGALEEVLNICTSFQHTNRGFISDLTPEDRYRILQMSKELNNDGLAVLGVAIRRITMRNHTAAANNRHLESDMVFLGLISFFDPPKDSAKQALYQLAERGVKAKVLTGDSLSIAIRVCKEVGIMTTHVITGPDLDVLDQTKFHETVKEATVLARLTPIQKLRIVQSLQRVGSHVVGFLGDGINDSLALDAADVGISVDSGASVAKNNADIILLEKDLNVLISGVERGRLTYGNTMKYIKMSLVANFSSIISILIATIFLQFEPLNPRQLLTQNFIYSLGQIVIPWDKMEEGYTQNPRRWSSKELPAFMLWNGPVCSICDVANLLLLRFYYVGDQGPTSAFVHSSWFVEGLLMQALIIHMIRTSKIPFLQDMASWPVILSTIIVSSFGIIAPFTLLGNIMGLTGLPLSYYGFLVVLFLGYFSLGQVVKRAYIMVYKQWL